MAAVSYQKFLKETVVSEKLTVLVDWLQILPNIEDNNNNVQVRVLDGTGMYWEFYLSKRGGRFKKPVFQSKEWLQFVRYKRLMVGDKFVIQKEDDNFRGAQYRVRVQDWCVAVGPAMKVVGLMWRN